MNYQNFQFRGMFLVQLILAILLASSLFAQNAGPVWIPIGTPTHTSKSTGGPWSEASTWNEGTVPGADSNVSITSGTAVTGVSGNAAFIIVQRGGRLELSGDLEVTKLLWVRGNGTLNIGAHTLSGGTLRLGWTSESATLNRTVGSKIRTKTWDHFRTNVTMKKLDRVENLYLSNFNGVVTTFTTASRFNVTGSVWVERGGTSGTTTLELGDDLDLSGDFSMREGVLKDNGYNVTVAGQLTNGNSKLWGWNGMKTERGGGNLIARKMVFGRAATGVSFRGSDIVLDQFKTVNIYRSFPDFDITQYAPAVTRDGQMQYIRSTSGLTIENAADDAFVLGRNSATDQTEITLNWDENQLQPGLDWILRWKGNHVAALKNYVSNGQLKAGTVPEGQRFNAELNIFYDSANEYAELAYTYIGFKKPGAVANVAIPALATGTSVPYLTEGPKDPNRTFVPTSGTVKAVMLFVDFPDVPAGTRTTGSVADHLLGNGRVQMLFKTQSYGKMALDVTRIDGWKRMPKEACEYKVKKQSAVKSLGPCDTGANPDNFEIRNWQSYIRDAVNLFPNIKFSDYQLVYLVAPPGPGAFVFSPAHYPNIQTSNGTIRNLVTLNTDSYTNRFMNLVHETGHELGLPDLYPLSPAAPPHRVGPWDVMGVMNTAHGFFGWHRHKMGWLDQQRKTFLPSGTHEIVLTRLSSCCGTSMAVIPAGIPANPSKVFVVELTEPILTASSNEQVNLKEKLFEMSNSDGVLIYSVDATIATGQHPVKVYPKVPRPTGDTDDKSYLWQAPWDVGDTFNNATTPVTGAPMKVEVLEKIGTGRNSSYKVRITVNSQTAAND